MIASNGRMEDKENTTVKEKPSLSLLGCGWSKWMNMDLNSHTDKAPNQQCSRSMLCWSACNVQCVVLVLSSLLDLFPERGSVRGVAEEDDDEDVYYYVLFWYCWIGLCGYYCTEHRKQMSSSVEPCLPFSFFS